MKSGLAAIYILAGGVALFGLSAHLQRRTTAQPTADTSEVSCTFNSATAYLRNSDDFYGAWWAEASEMYGFDPTYRFTIADFPNPDDRWPVEAPDLDLAACMAVERVKAVLKKSPR